MTRTQRETIAEKRLNEVSKHSNRYAKGMLGVLVALGYDSDHAETLLASAELDGVQWSLIQLMALIPPKTLKR